MGGPDQRSLLGQDRLSGAVVLPKTLVHPWQEGNGQVFPLYPTSLSLEKAIWSLGHSCPCDIMAIFSSTILPASARANGAATRGGCEHLNHCPQTMGSKCCVRLRHSLPRAWGVVPWQREALDDFKGPREGTGSWGYGDFAQRLVLTHAFSLYSDCRSLSQIMML